MQRLKHRLLSLFILCALTVSVSAKESTPGEVELQTAASTEVETDLMIARMTADFEDTNPGKLAAKINDAMAWALKQSKDFPEVTVKGGSYSTYPVYKDKAISHWRGSQQMILETTQVAKLSELVGTLQQKLLIQGVDYRLSEGKQTEVENVLIERALGAFKQRAALIQNSLGAESYRLHKLNVQTESRHPPRPTMRTLAEPAAADTARHPQFTPGFQKVKIHVNGSIILSPIGASN